MPAPAGGTGALALRMLPAGGAGFALHREGCTRTARPTFKEKKPLLCLAENNTHTTHNKNKNKKP
jgi:hypothetical protein